MSRTINYLDAPTRMQELWHWVTAIDAWDYKDPAPLAELVVKEDIPNELKPIVSNILLGARKQKRASKIPANERMEIAKAVSGILYMIDDFRNGKVHESYGYEKETGLCTHSGEVKGSEPSDMMNCLPEEHRKQITDAATQLNVSTETVENLLRDMRKKINNWPNV